MKSDAKPHCGFKGIFFLALPSEAGCEFSRQVYEPARVIFHQAVPVNVASGLAAGYLPGCFDVILQVEFLGPWRGENEVGPKLFGGILICFLGAQQAGENNCEQHQQHEYESRVMPNCHCPEYYQKPLPFTWPDCALPLKRSRCINLAPTPIPQLLFELDVGLLIPYRFYCRRRSGFPWLIKRN